MLEAISSIFAALKQTSPVILLGISAATGFLIAGSHDALDSLGLVDFRTQHRTYIGGTFLLSSSLLAAQGVVRLWRGLVYLVQQQRKKRRAAKWLAQHQEQLHRLSPDEKAYLAPFILENENTLYFKIEDGVAGGLVSKDILYRSSNIGSVLTGFAHNMQPWARDYLEQHPELLDGANPRPSGPPSW